MLPTKEDIARLNAVTCGAIQVKYLPLDELFCVCLLDNASSHTLDYFGPFNTESEANLFAIKLREAKPLLPIMTADTFSFTTPDYMSEFEMVSRYNQRSTYLL